MTPKLLAMIKDVKPASDEEIERWTAEYARDYKGLWTFKGTPYLSLIARIVAERKVVETAAALASAVRKLGLEELVHGWHASGAYDRHPDELGCTLPTNCGTVYAIAAALSALEERTHG